MLSYMRNDSCQPCIEHLLMLSSLNTLVSRRYIMLLLTRVRWLLGLLCYCKPAIALKRCYGDNKHCIRCCELLQSLSSSQQHTPKLLPN